MDLGLAQLADDAEGRLTRTRQFVGTLRYASPEQVLSVPLDRRSDVYSLGATLWELLTLQPLFGATEATPTPDLMLKVQSADPEPTRRHNPRVPADLDAVVLKCLEKDRSRRYGTAAELAADLDRWLRGEPVHAQPPTLGYMLGKYLRRHRTGVLTGSLALVLITASLAGGLTLEGRRQRQARKFLSDQRAQAQAHCEQLRQSARADETLARNELHADRFASAEMVLSQAIERLRSEPVLAALAARLESQRSEVHHLVEFTRMGDEAERLEAILFDDEAEAACEAALRHLSIRGRERWWEHLPARDLLEPAQVAQLQQEAYRQLLLLSGIRAKRARMNLGKSAAVDAYKRGLETVAVARRFRPDDRTGQILELFCHNGLGQTDRARPVPPGEPQSAVDYYFMGVLHLFAHWMPDDPVTKFFTARPRELSGLDFKTPLDTADQYLRSAAVLMPRHYWTYSWLGDAFGQAERPEKAELAFDACVALRPDFALAYANRAHSIIGQFDRTTEPRTKNMLLDRGLKDLEQAVRLDPNDFEVVNLQAVIFNTLGRPRELVSALGKLFDLWTIHRNASAWSLAFERNMQNEWIDALIRETNNGWDNADIWGTIATAYLVTDRLDDAEGAVKRALAHRGDDARALACRGTLLLRRNQPEAALADFSAALARAPVTFAAAIGRAQAHEAMGHQEKALADYDEALRVAVIGWHRRDAHLGRARVLNRLGRPTESAEADRSAREAFGTRSGNGTAQPGERSNTVPATGRDPSTGSQTDWKQSLILTYRAEDQLARGAVDRAIKICDEAIQLDPEYHRVFGTRGNAYFRKGDYRKALADYKQAVRLRPLWTYNHSNLAGASLHCREFDDAIREAGEAIGLDPKNHYAAWIRGCARLAQRDYPGAIADHTSAIALAPEVAAYYIDRGDSYRLHGDLDRAVADYHEGLRLAPQQHRARYDRGLLHLARYDSSKAIADFDVVARAWSDSAPLFVARGDGHAQIGQWHEAERDFALALKLDPSLSRVWYWHALVSRTLGDIDGSRRACKGAFDQVAAGALDPDGAVWAAWSSVLVPEAGMKLGQVLRIIEKTNVLDPKDDADLLIGAIKLRGDAPADAIASLEAAAKNHTRRGRFLAAPRFPPRMESDSQARLGVESDTACAKLFLAIAHARLEHCAEARHWLDSASSWIKENIPIGQEASRFARSLSWEQRLKILGLLREAERSVLDAEFPEDPFTP
jgi:tetratricopeptide (TPR) repeat protein